MTPTHMSLNVCTHKKHTPHVHTQNAIIINNLNQPIDTNI